MQSREGATLRKASLRYAPSHNRERGFFFKMPPAASRSSYISETNVIAKVIDYIINWNPCIVLDKPVEIPWKLTL
jgi:hypothetical protein